MNMGDENFNFLWHEIQAISDTDRNATYDLNIDDNKDNYWTTNATLTGMANYTIEIEMKSGLVIIIHGPKEIKYANKEKEIIIRGINRTVSIKYTYPTDGASVRMVKLRGKGEKS